MASHYSGALPQALYHTIPRFLRAPCYFRTTYEGKPATEGQVGVLSRLVRSIRKLVLRESERQGKPLLLAARVPVTAALCRHVGIDIAGWLEEKLLDLLVLSGGYVAFDQPLAPLIALAHKHDVPAYPCLSDSGLRYRPPRGKGEPMEPAVWKGAALRCWEAGADGIYVFNLFPGPGPRAQRDRAVAILKAIGAKETLLQADRVFAVSDAGNYMPAHYWAKDAEEFSGALPLSLGSRSETAVPLVVAGPVQGEERKAATELRLDFTGLPEANVPAVSLNARALGKPTHSEAVAGVRRLRFAVPAGAARMGKNEVRLEVSSDGVKLAGAELWIRAMK
jgi:hypothetical protein